MVEFQDPFYKDPSYFLSQNKGSLSLFEQEECQTFSNFYYWGQKCNKIYNKIQYNQGFDDAQGDYMPLISDHIQYRYEIIKPLGHGAACRCFKAYDYKTLKYVCLKIFKNRNKYLQLGLNEINILQYINEECPQVVKLYTNFVFRNHLVLSLELGGINLYELLLMNKMQPFHQEVINSISSQLLSFLDYLHKHQIVHADLKPENIIFINHETTEIKVIDFDHSFYFNENQTSDLQALLYRAPETILKLPVSEMIDIWSFGCILAEVSIGQPLFRSGSELLLLSQIQELIGKPFKCYSELSPKNKEFFENDALRSELGCSSRFLAIDGSVLEIVQACIRWDPSKRSSAESLLKYSLFSSVTRRQLGFENIQEIYKTGENQFHSSSNRNQNDDYLVESVKLKMF